MKKFLLTVKINNNLPSHRFDMANVDIMAQKGDALAILEVKWRSNTYFSDLQSFVFKKQQLSLITGADHYVNSNGFRRSCQF